MNFAIIVLFLCVPQTRHAPAKAKISDSFAKAAILAARSIQDQHSKDVSKETQTKLDVADSDERLGTGDRLETAASPHSKVDSLLEIRE